MLEMHVKAQSSESAKDSCAGGPTHAQPGANSLLCGPRGACGLTWVCWLEKADSTGPGAGGGGSAFFMQARITGTAAT